MSLRARQPLDRVIDLHIHTYPEIHLDIPNAAYDHEWLAEAIAAGMRAVCLKSHYWPTTGNAHLLGCILPGIDVFGGIVLNSTVGGFNPLAVEVAIGNGAKVVWFPTFSAKNDVERGGYSSRVASRYGTLAPPYLQVIDAKGRLLPEVESILRIIAKAGVALATGHLSVAESMVLIRVARELGVERIILTHPLTSMVGASLEEQAQAAAMGALIEHCFLPTLPMHQRLSLDTLVESIRAVGARNCILSTDAVFAWNPTPPRMMQMFIETLTQKGVREDEIDMMSRQNPAYLLGLEKRSA
jgi:hypothetical protein